MLSTLTDYKGVLIGVGAVLLVGLLLARVFNQGGGAAAPLVTLSAEHAAEHIGSRAEVCGTVAEVTYARALGGAPTFINLERPHPDQPFTAVIWGTDRQRWRTPPEARYADQAVCVRGTLRSHEGTPQIVVSRPGQISVR
jgi:hypothetical protein